MVSSNQRCDYEALYESIVACNIGIFAFVCFSVLYKLVHAFFRPELIWIRSCIFGLLDVGFLTVPRCSALFVIAK